MTATFERNYFVQHGTEDDSAKARQAKEAERDHRERLAAVRVVAGLVTDATEAREFYAMLGLTDTDIREARRSVVAVPSKPAAAASRRRSAKVTAA
jgi:transposase